MRQGTGVVAPSLMARTALELSMRGTGVGKGKDAGVGRAVAAGLACDSGTRMPASSMVWNVT